MAIPDKTVNDIIIKAFFLINEYSPSELPTPDEIAEGLDYLNELLDNLSGNDIYIPYTNEITFNTVANQQKYIFAQKSTADVVTNKLVEIMDAYLNYDGINMPLSEIQHDEAYQIMRYPQSYTRPTQIFLQDTNDTSEIFLFSTPDRAYSITIRAKQVFDNLELQQEITNVPKHYHRFLRYALARELASVFETNTWNEVKESEYVRMLEDIKASGDTDWSLNISGILRTPYKGWTKGSIITG